MLGGLFSAIGKGIGAVAKGVGKANKYTMGKVGEIANKASGYEPDMKGPAPKISTDTFGNASLSTPKVQDPNSFKGRGGFAGAVKRVASGDANVGRPGARKLLSPDEESKPTAKAPAAKKARATLQPPEYEKSEFNPNWRNWKSQPK